MENKTLSFEEELPAFNAHLRDQILKILSATTNDHISVTDEDWTNIGNSVASFQQRQVTIRGFLTKGEWELMKKSVGQAEKLNNALIKLGNSATPILYSDQISTEEFEVFRNILEILAATSLSTPPNEGMLKKIISAEKEESSWELQRQLDKWWENKTNQKPKLQEELGPRTDYSRFLETIFSAIPEEMAPTHSTTAIKVRRAHSGKTLKISERQREMFLKLHNRINKVR